MSTLMSSLQVSGWALVWLFGCSGTDSGPVAVAATTPVEEEKAPEVVLPDPVEGPLAGLNVVVSPGHGKLLHRDLDGVTPFDWAWQRDRRHGVREDEWTHAFVVDELTPALEAAGATVLSLRERDRHSTGVVVDDQGAGFKAWTVLQRPDTDQAEGGAHTRLSRDGVARWTVRAPEQGHWYLYARWVRAGDQDADAHYIVDVGGKRTRVDVDQQHTGGHWWPLGHFDLMGNQEVTVTLVGSGEGTMSADAVRLGGGTFHARFPAVGANETIPWADAAAVHSLPILGGPEDLLTLPDGKPTSDMRFRSRWTSWALGDVADESVFLSVHTNAGSGRGTTIFVGHDPDVSPPLPVTPGSRSLGAHLSASLKSSLVTFDRNWRHRGPLKGNYSEVSPFWNKLDGTLLELAFHDHRGDVEKLRNPEWRQAAADAIVAGLVQWRSKR